MAASDDDISAFFGATSGLKRNVWTQDDLVMGRIIAHHYQCQTIPRLNDDSTNAEERIPHTIHFVWLGGKPLPLVSDLDSDENDCIQSWRRYHPEWQVQVWRDEDIAERSLFNNQALEYALRERNYGMASDIVRLELLYEHGGLYVDIDYLCYESLERLHDRCCFDFYCGASNTGAVELNNGLMACQPYHVLIRAMMERIHQWFNDFTKHSQPFALMSAFLDPSSQAMLHQVTRLSPEDVIRNTGPGLLTMMTAQVLIDPSVDTDRIGILPYQVFHPLPNRFRGHRLVEQLLEEYVVPGQTKAVHLWQCSWQ